MLLKLIKRAGVPEHLSAIALNSLNKAKKDKKGLLKHKLNVRIFKAKEISRILSWDSERLLAVRPELASWDVAPMLNITGYGDNHMWNENGPYQHQWLDPDPTTTNHRTAVERNYWCKGEHPRSAKSRKAWYRRNGGEFEAYTRGIAVAVADGPPEVWENDGVKVMRIKDAWFLETKLYGFIAVRIGYEVGNLWVKNTHGDWVQAWYPIPGYELRAPLTWSFIPFK